MKRIEQAIHALMSDDHDTWQEAQVYLANNARHEAVPGLVELLHVRDPRIRNRAAVTLRMIGATSATEALLDAIQDARNTGNIGTMVAALQTHDCSRHFTSLFRIILHGSYEVRARGLPILEQQRFIVSDDEVLKLKEELSLYRRQPDLRDEDKSLVARLMGIVQLYEIR